MTYLNCIFVGRLDGLGHFVIVLECSVASSNQVTTAQKTQSRPAAKNSTDQRTESIEASLSEQTPCRFRISVNNKKVDVLNSTIIRFSLNTAIKRKVFRY